MQVDLKKIEQFYKSELGRLTYSKINQSLSKCNVVHKNDACVCSTGFFPFFDSVTKAKRAILQSYNLSDDYPEKGEGHYVVTDPTAWPYRAEDVDKIILMHDLEFMNDADVYLREAWRVLKGEGELTIIIPNRAGRWARADNTPFGQGYPYSIDQIEKLLGKAHFSIDDVKGCLFAPPNTTKSVVINAYYSLLNYIGPLCFLTPGLLMIKASKHIYSPSNGSKVMDAAQKAGQVLFPKPVANSKSHKNHP